MNKLSAISISSHLFSLLLIFLGFVSIVTASAGECSAAHALPSICGHGQFVISEIIAAARHSKRSMTTAEFASRQNSRIEKMRGLDRAKIELAQGRFAESKKQLDQILAKQPNDANAHYVTGMLFDTWGLNHPDKAEAAYQRVAQGTENGDNRSLAFSAAYLRARMLQRIGRSKEAAAVAKQILSDYPRIDSPGTKDAVQRLSDEKK